MRKPFILLACTFIFLFTSAQEKLNVKFGRITPADFSVTSPLIDSNVNAVVLSDIGSSEFLGNNKGWFSLIFKRHRRVKIINSKGFDAAEVNIVLYSNGNDVEKLEGLSANTYNLENGEVVTTKLESKSVFEEKIRRNLVRKKFTFPALKPGSIIEYTYTINSDFIFNLQPWDFQGDYPCLWSEYSVSIPDFFDYVYLSQGHIGFQADTRSNHNTSFYVRSAANSTSGGDQGATINSNVADRRWVAKDVPALKEESFTSTINNHISKIEFQLSAYHFPEQPYESVMGDWLTVSKKLLDRTEFGLPINRGNGWLDDDLKTILKGITQPEEKAKKIYDYVRDNFTCTSTYGIYLGDNVALKDVFKKKSGTVSEINLLLIAMLKHESIQAEPVIMSLRSRGFVHPIYPLLDRFNYLICQVTTQNSLIYLDASRPYLGYNKLHESCYNGDARVIERDKPLPVSFPSDSLMENKVTSVFIINGEKDRIEGAFSSQLGDNESYKFREKYFKSGREAVQKELMGSQGSELKIDNLVIDSLKLYDEPVGISFDFVLNKNDEDVIYFNPMMGEGIKKNPFTSAERFYPVEMPYRKRETYILDMEIPKGYIADEIPKSIRFRLNGEEGSYEFICVKSAQKIQLRSVISINKANFSQDDYQTLRDFFSNIIKKQNEQIVFKKAK